MAIIYKQGMKGLAMIGRIQKAVGCYPDCNYGPLTTEAVKRYQKDAGLKADGICGPATLAMLGLKEAAEKVFNQTTPNPSLLSKEGSIMHRSVAGKCISLKKSKRKIDEIIIHCTATPEGREYHAQDVKRWHREQGWADIGYHYVITLDGDCEVGRDADTAGAHCYGHNARTIGVVYVGGLEPMREGVPVSKLKAKDTRTEQQKAELMSLLIDLRRLYPEAKIIGHRHYEKNKDCPSFDADTAYRYV